MNLTLKFKNISDCNGIPLLRLKINGQVCWQGNVEPVVSVESAVQGSVDLSIEHYGKNSSTDVKVDNNIIVQDRSCELETVIVDGYDIEELKWHSYYRTEDGETLDKCLFFGKNGHWNIKLELPVLRWILKTRHDMLNNDPTWEQDYESYVQACKLLNN